MSNGKEGRILPVSDDVDWAKWAKRGVSVARTTIELGLAIKTRNVALLALGAASAAETVADWTDKNKVEPSIDERLRAIGVRPLFTQTQVTRFLVQTCRELALPTYKLVTGAGDKETPAGSHDDKVVVYELSAEDKVYTLYTGAWLEAIYGTSRRDVIAALSRAVKESLGDYITLTVAFENWSAYTGLAPTDVYLDSYVSPVPITVWCDRLRRFQERGLNRASLLYGKPGTGKTTFAAAVSQHLDGRLLIIEARSLNRIMESGFELGKLVTIVSPRVILFDDLDRVEGLDQLFGEIERLNRVKRSQEILILASVNNLKKLPSALRREGRFDEKLKFMEPDVDLRRKILKAHMDVEQFHLGRTQDFDRLLEWTEGMVGSALREVVLQLSVRPFSEIEEHIQVMKAVGEAGEEDPDEKTTTPDAVCKTRSIG